MNSLDNRLMILCNSVAGTDTVSTSLSYWFWELSRRPDIMRKLQAEIDVAMPDAHTIPDISVLQKLPFLNAFVKEGERSYLCTASAFLIIKCRSTNLRRWSKLSRAGGPGFQEWCCG
jgi:cytochrome P450